MAVAVAEIALKIVSLVTTEATGTDAAVIALKRVTTKVMDALLAVIAEIA